MTMKGLIPCGTPFILSHKPNNTARYSLQRILTISKMDKCKRSWLSGRLNGSVWGATGHRGLVSGVKHNFSASPISNAISTCKIKLHSSWSKQRSLPSILVVGYSRNLILAWMCKMRRYECLLKPSKSWLRSYKGCKTVRQQPNDTSGDKKSRFSSFVTIFDIFGT